MFQFHTGSIKSVSEDTVADVDESFNSTLVRLKAFAQGHQCHCVYSFNSTLVRLKADFSPYVEPLTSFNSTLVRLKASAEECDNCCKPGFNSTLVRLKESQNNRVLQREVLFQFHTGSIKREHIERIFSVRLGFNSTLVRLKVDRLEDVTGRLAGFNSTLVRLKVKRYWLGIVALFEFQFHTGSIKSNPLLIAFFHLWISFNSTLVRLKGKWR